MASRRGSRIEQVPTLEDGGTIVITDTHFRKASVAVENFAQVSAEARDASHSETQMSLGQALRLYPKAVGWSVLLSAAIIMEGYDVILLGNLYAFPAFTERFGVLVEGSNPPQYAITPDWQNGLSNGAQVGEIMGLYAAGWIVDRIGYKKTMMVALTLMIAFIFLPFFATSLGVLLAGEILQGIPWGVFQTMTTAYASEVAPVALRAYLTTYVNLCWVIGQLIASGVLRAFLDRTDLGDWAWRIPFGLQWMWPLPLLIGVAFAPESPWWYVRHGKLEDAKHSLLRLTSRNSSTAFNADETLAMMVHTNEIEKSASGEGISYLDCFKGVDGRRTEIACFTWVIQAFCGSSFMGFSTTFYKSAGLSDDGAFDLTLGQFALGALGTVISWFAMIYFGRRTLYVGGLTVQCVLLALIGFLGLANQSNTSITWAIGSMLMLFTFVYDMTVGPVCYSLVAEIPSTRLKAKTVVLARNFYNIAGIINNVITPRMLNPLAWNWGAKSGFFWFGACFLCLTWTFFRLPEPKGRTYGELDVLFEQHVPARKFKSTNVDIFRSEHLAVIDSNGSAEKAAEHSEEGEKMY